MAKKENVIKKICLGAAFIDIVILVMTPFIKLRLFGLREEFLEMIIIAILLLFLFFVYYFYLKENREQLKYQLALEERLRESFKYIGAINLQMEEIKKAFAGLSKYPESKKDINALFIYSAEKILSIINSNWVVLRIFDIDSFNTLQEYFLSRGNKENKKIKIDNHDILISKKEQTEFFIIKSDQQNFNIKACAILACEPASHDQEFLVRSIINQLEMLFIVFDSLYYKK